MVYRQNSSGYFLIFLLRYYFSLYCKEINFSIIFPIDICQNQLDGNIFIYCASHKSDILCNLFFMPNAVTFYIYESIFCIYFHIYIVLVIFRYEMHHVLRIVAHLLT